MEIEGEIERVAAWLDEVEIPVGIAHDIAGLLEHAKATTSMTVGQLQGMRLWDNADEQGRYWLYERTRAELNAVANALREVVDEYDDKGIVRSDTMIHAAIALRRSTS